MTKRGKQGTGIKEKTSDKPFKVCRKRTGPNKPLSAPFEAPIYLLTSGVLRRLQRSIQTVIGRQFCWGQKTSAGSALALSRCSTNAPQPCSTKDAIPVKNFGKSTSADPAWVRHPIPSGAPFFGRCRDLAVPAKVNGGWEATNCYNNSSCNELSLRKSDATGDRHARSRARVEFRRRGHAGAARRREPRQADGPRRETDAKKAAGVRRRARSFRIGPRPGLTRGGLHGPCR